MVRLRRQPLNRELDETGTSLFQLAGADDDRASVWWLHSSLSPPEDNRFDTGRLSRTVQGSRKSGGFYAGRGLSKQLIEVREGEVRPNDCQMPMNHINKKSDEPKIEVSVLPHFQASCLSLCT